MIQEIVFYMATGVIVCVMTGVIVLEIIDTILKRKGERRNER